jgi:hypothetical protein
MRDEFKSFLSFFVNLRLSPVKIHLLRVNVRRSIGYHQRSPFNAINKGFNFIPHPSSLIPKKKLCPSFTRTKQKGIAKRKETVRSPNLFATGRAF